MNFFFFPLGFLTTHIERAGLKLDDSDIVRTRSRTLQEVEDLEVRIFFLFFLKN